MPYGLKWDFGGLSPFTGKFNLPQNHNCSGRAWRREELEDFSSEMLNNEKDQS
jgi:hypothetical protein